MRTSTQKRTSTNAHVEYADKKARLEASWRQGDGPLRLEKSTISNLFRYAPRTAAGTRVSLGDFNRVIALDEDAATLEVEGLTTFETIVSATLPRGFLPLVAPELKHITIGGATVGIGIESTCFRHGFVHDSLIEADVLLPDGAIVTCTPDNEHADLFFALPNSYGTLGYILRAKIKLHRARPFTQLTMTVLHEPAAYLEAMREACNSGAWDFVEGLFFEDRRFILMTGRMADRVAYVDDILRKDIFYRLVETRREVSLRTHDYIFRYDPEWFWNLPETWGYDLFRRYAPERFRNSSFYTKYVAVKERVRERLTGGAPKATEPLIQDWEVPWEQGVELIEFCLAEVDLEGRPWAAVPIKTPRTPTLYPIEADTLYFNLGSYCQVTRPEGRGNYYYTRIMDRKCFDLGGIKMLYSSTFLDEAEFNRRFNGAAYSALKHRYDPNGHALGLYTKIAASNSRC